MERTRTARISIALISLLGFALACAHASTAETKAAPHPLPDVAAIHEAIAADACRPGEASQACPADSFEPQAYVSARAYSHLLAALIATQTESWAQEAD